VSIAQGRVRAPVVAVAQPADQTSGSGNIGHTWSTSDLANERPR